MDKKPCSTQTHSLLVDKSLTWGASRAAVLPADQIRLRDDLASLCLTCPSHGLALSCPPHSGGPERFKNWLTRSRNVLFFSIDVDTAVLVSSQRYEVFQILHDMAAGLESAAKELGFSEARAFAGGSCKSVFCMDHVSCSALAPQGRCPFPHRARPSMSGFGIDVAALIRVAGWKKQSLLEHKGLSGQDRSGIYGLVLLGPGR